MIFCTVNKLGTIATFIDTGQIEYLRASRTETNVQCVFSFRSGRSVNVNLSHQDYDRFVLNFYSSQCLSEIESVVVNPSDSPPATSTTVEELLNEIENKNETQQN